MLVSFATFEHLPIRVGGLGEAATSLAEALVRERAQVMVLMPSHGLHMRSSDVEWSRYGTFKIHACGEWHETTVYEGLRNAVRIFLFSNHVLDHREVYGGWENLMGKVLHFSKGVPAFFNLFLKREDWKPDVFHCNDWHAVLAGYLGKRFFKIPMVYTVHRLCRPAIPVEMLERDGYGEALEERYIHDGQFYLEPFGADLCDALNTVSYTYLNEEWKTFFKHLAGKATYVWNGIDYAFWNPEKIKHPALSRAERRKILLKENSLEEGILFFYVGRLDREQKGVDHFLNAIDLVMESGGEAPERFRFILLGAGDPELEERIRQMERQYPRHVRGIIGYLERPATREYYAGADFCVIPSNFEPFGLVQLEAMCLGCIPLGTRVGGINDTVIDVDSRPYEATGKLVAPRDPGSLAQAIEEMGRWALERPDLVEAIRRNGRPHVMRKFSWDQAAKRYLKLYEGRATVKVPFAQYPEPY